MTSEIVGLFSPTNIDDVILDEQNIIRLKQMITDRSPMDMIFHGGIGTGKTSAAKLMMEAISPETGHRLNGASNADRKYILEQLTDYASSRGFFYDGELTVIDQADLLPKQAQNEVLWVLERPTRLARLILVVNDEKKILPAIRSRLLPICFDVVPEKRDDAKARLGERYCSILSKVGITCPRSRIDEIVNTYFPDMWKIESALEWEFPIRGSHYDKKAVELHRNEQKEHQPV